MIGGNNLTTVPPIKIATSNGSLKISNSKNNSNTFIPENMHTMSNCEKMQVVEKYIDSNQCYTSRAQRDSKRYSTKFPPKIDSFVSKTSINLPAVMINSIKEPGPSDLSKKRQIKNRTNSQEIQTSAFKKWYVMLNVFKAINKMRNIQTKTLKSIDDIDVLVNMTHSPKKEANAKMQEISQIDLNTSENVAIIDKKCHDDSDIEEMRVFNEIRKQFILYDYVASGDPENIDKIRKGLENDPERKNKDLKTINISNLIVNKPDNNGKTLLYLASVNGHLEIVKLLLSYNADPYFRCKNSGEEESVLDSTIRWKQVLIVKWYLDNIVWSYEYLMNASRIIMTYLPQHIELTKKIKELMKKHKKKSVGCCMCK